MIHSFVRMPKEKRIVYHICLIFVCNDFKFHYNFSFSHCNDISILYECAYVIVGNLPPRKDYKSE